MTKLPIIESYWVEENRFLAGEYPGSHDPEITRRRMDLFLEAGINTFIDFTEANEHVPYEAILKEQARAYDMDAQYHRFAIHDHGICSPKIMVDILNTIDKALDNQRNVYIHCWGGVGRTGIVVGCYLVRHGVKNEQAVEQVNKLYATRPASPYYPRSPETVEQVNFILNWHDATLMSTPNFSEE